MKFKQIDDTKLEALRIKRHRLREEDAGMNKFHMVYTVDGVKSEQDISAANIMKAEELIRKQYDGKNIIFTSKQQIKEDYNALDDFDAARTIGKLKPGDKFKNRNGVEIEIIEPDKLGRVQFKIGNDVRSGSERSIQNMLYKNNYLRLKEKLKEDFNNFVGKPVKDWIVDGLLNNAKDRLNKLKEINAPEIMINGQAKYVKKLEDGNLKGIVSGDSRALNSIMKNVRRSVGNGGKSFFVINDASIFYYPNAKYGPYIKYIGESSNKDECLEENLKEAYNYKISYDDLIEIQGKIDRLIRKIADNHQDEISPSSNTYRIGLPFIGTSEGYIDLQNMNQYIESHEDDWDEDEDYDESLNEDIESPEKVLEADEKVPQTEETVGLSNMIIKEINGEWETISNYNDLISLMRAEGQDDMINVISDIIDEEHKHVGQLQKCLQLISPNVSEIDSGETEAIGQLDVNDNLYANDNCLDCVDDDFGPNSGFDIYLV